MWDGKDLGSYEWEDPALNGSQSASLYHLMSFEICSAGVQDLSYLGTNAWL